MSTIDWSKAPEGTTHFRRQGAGYVSHWLKPGHFCVTDFESEGWKEGDVACSMFVAIARPVEWNGEGLPPVGTVCEWLMDLTWKVVEIRYLSKHTILASLVDDDGDDPEFALCPEDQEFRPVRTAEQIEAEERENTIKSMISVIKHHRFATKATPASPKEEARIAAEALFEAGCRLPAEVTP